MSEENPRYFKTIKEWNEWLGKNHENEDRIWIIIQKKASKKVGIRYEEAVLEAVAHGWIDGKMKRLNENELMQRFTPRRSNSLWSQSNRERAVYLISLGKMTDTGLKTVEEAIKNGRWDKAYSTHRGKIEVPDDLVEALKKNEIAFDIFTSFPPYARFMYIHWINEAKRRDARIRRIFTVVDRSANNLKPGIDIRIKKNDLGKIIPITVMFYQLLVNIR
jgi:uncharacterized protein YdeI (YjbR/CyaY-like superfamily)